YSGNRYVDVNGELWLDPQRPEVADYNSAIALAAIEAGFQEIQLDYIRYPETDYDHSFLERVDAIAGIVAEIKMALNGKALLTLDLLGDSTIDYPESHSD